MRAMRCDMTAGPRPTRHIARERSRSARPHGPDAWDVALTCPAGARACVGHLEAAQNGDLEQAGGADDAIAHRSVLLSQRPGHGTRLRKAYVAQTDSPSVEK